MDLAGKAALLTGGARIGHTVAEALAHRGCAVALTYRTSRQAAERTADAVRAAGARAVVLRADATEQAEVDAAVAATVAAFGRLDVLVAMASTYEKTPLDRVTRKDWSDAIDANATSAFLFALAAAPHMRAAGAGRIVTVNDWIVPSGRPRYLDYTPYYAAKAALAGLTESLALELAPTILVNAVAPGPVLAPADLSADEVARVAAATPLGRWGGAGEVAKAVLFLLETDFVTGETIRVDGGRHLR